jgi:hypothetical protein
VSAEASVKVTVHNLSAPRAFPSMNAWHGGPDWKYRRVKADWLREFPPAALHRARGPRCVTIVRLYAKKRGQRRYDDDNLRGGAKPILDALRAHGWLVNDSPQWCTLEVHQRHPKPHEGLPRTIILVTYTEPERGTLGGR